MKIGINVLGRPLDDTGGRTYLTGLIGGLAKLELTDDIFIFLHPSNANFFQQFHKRIRTVAVPGGSLRKMRPLIEHFILPGCLLKTGIEVLYSPNNSVPLKSPCPVVMGLQNVLPFFENADEGWLRGHYRRWIIPRSATRASRIIVPSQYAKDLLMKIIRKDENDVSVIPHGIDREVFHPRGPLADISEKRPYILWASWFWGYKNWELALMAFSILKNHTKNTYCFHMAGKIPDPTVRRKIHQLGLDQDVLLLGQIPPESLAQEYRDADLFVYPSKFESFGFPVLEAMACGVPVVASGCPALREISDHAAIHVEPLTPESFAQAIHNVLSNPEMKQRMVKQGLERAHSFSWLETAKKTLRIIKNSLNTQQSSLF